jgi:hypothetical protein
MPDGKNLEVHLSASDYDALVADLRTRLDITDTAPAGSISPSAWGAYLVLLLAAAEA